METNGHPEDRFLLTLPPEPRYVGTSRAFAASIARQFECDEERVQDLKVAVSEACSNAIKSHMSSELREPVRIVVRHGREGLSYEISDSGKGFDPPEIRTDFGVDEIERGIGVMLIRALFPESEIARNDTGGMTVRIPLSLVS